MDKLNELRLLAGLPIIASREVTKKEPVTEDVAEVLEEMDHEVDEKVVAKVMDAVRQTIASLKKDAAGEDDDHLKEMYLKDATDFTRVLKLMKDGKHEQAMKRYRDMDTAAREHLSDPLVVPKIGDRRAAAKYFKYTLLKEAEHKAKKDYDGDGKIESSEEEHKGVVDKKIKEKKGRVDEAKKEDKTPKNKKPDFPEEMKDGKEGVCQKEHDKKAKEIDKVVSQNDATDNPKKEVKVKESMNAMTTHFNDFEEDPAKPVNAVRTNDDPTVFDKPNDPANDKDESPCQLDALGKQSMTDHETKLTCPPSLIAALQREIDQARKDADFVGASTANKEAKVFYNDMADAFEHLRDCLKMGNVNSFKKAQIFYSSLMGPMLHKIPAEVGLFIVNGGKTRSLKDFMKKAADPITGPRNTLS